MGDRTLSYSLSSDFTKSMQITLGPEWLKQKNENHITHLDSIPDDGRSTSPMGRGSPRMPPKSRVPLKYLRSQSSPLLMQPQDPIPTDENKNPIVPAKPTSFEDSFPSLSTKSTVPNTASAWKQPPIEALTKQVNEKTNGHTKNGSRDEKSTHDDLEALKGLVPTAPPPKVIRNKIEGTKRNPPKSAGIAPTKPPPPPQAKLLSPNSFRKAISEPSLPLSPTYKEKYAKLIANGNSKPPAPPTEKTDSRNDFFLGLLKEEQKKKGQTDTNEKDHSSGENCDSTRNSRSSSSSSATNENNDFASQRKYEVSVEDEERFLRNLGWVPDEEDHVPELTEQEILEVQKVISKTNPPSREKSSNVTWSLPQKKWNASEIDPEHA